MWNPLAIFTHALVKKRASTIKDVIPIPSSSDENMAYDYSELNLPITSSNSDHFEPYVRQLAIDKFLDIPEPLCPKLPEQTVSS